MSKKFLSVMLALVMVLSVFSVCAFAASANYEDPDAEEAYTQMWYLETTNEPNANGDYTVDVYLETNYLVGAISFHVDAVGATLKSAEVSDFIFDDEGYNPNIQVNKSKGDVYIIPEPTDTAAMGLDFSSAQLVATLTYTLTDPSATISLVNDAKLIDNAGKLVAVRMADGILASDAMYYGQWVVDTEYNDVALGDPVSEVTLGAEEIANPVLIGVDTGVVDNETGYVYGVPAGADANDYFTVENGSFSIAETVTGAVLIVKNAAGEPFAAYTLIIFGDVDGNGAITAADSTVVKMAALGGAIDGGAAFELAADVDGNGEITAADSTVIKMASLGGEITVNPFEA